MKTIPAFKGTVFSGFCLSSWQSGNKNGNNNGCTSSRSQQLHRLSNDRRLQSLKERQAAVRNEKQLISQALKAVDTSPGLRLNKKVCFGSDDEETEKPTLNGNKRASTNDFTRITKDSGKTPLFDVDDTDSDDCDVGFRVRFEGKSAENLLKLEASFGGDQRFRLDDRFAENDVVSENRQEREAEVDSEKATNLRLLEDVLGKPVISARGAKKKRKLPMIRYDPDNPEHSRFELRKSPKVTEEKELPINNHPSAGDTPIEGNSETRDNDSAGIDDQKLQRYFVMEKSFAESLRMKEEPKKPFSLLASLGREVPENLPVHPKTISAETESLKGWQKSLIASQRFHKPTEDVRETEEDEGLSLKNESAKMAQSNSGRTFFFEAGDPRLLKAVQRFRRTQSLQIIRNKWEKYRPSLVKVLLELLLSASIVYAFPIISALTLEMIM